MPIYIFKCSNCEDNNAITSHFEKSLPMSKSATIPKCEYCGTSSGVSRDWMSESPSMFQDIKTLGSLADRNESKYSEDYKADIRKRNNEKMERKVHGKPNWRKKNE